MNNSEYEERVVGLYDWLQRSLRDRSVESVGEVLEICRNLLRKMCPDVVGCCLSCAVDAFYEFMTDGHCETKCSATMASLCKSPGWDVAGDAVVDISDELFKDWQTFNNGVWPLVPAILMVVENDCKEGIFERIKELSDPLGLLTVPCVDCLLNFRDDVLVFGHDEENCFLHRDSCNSHLAPSED